MNPSSFTSSFIGATLFLLARLPAPLRRAVAGVVGWLYAQLATDSRKVVIANVEHVREGVLAQGVDLGDAEQFAHRTMRASGYLLAETALCWRGPPEAWRQLIASVVGADALSHLRSTQTTTTNPVDGAKKTGALFLAPHLGNWEVLNMYMGAEFGLTVLYDPPKIAALEPVIRAARQRTSSTLLPIGPTGLRGMLQQLRDGGVVGLLPDQVPAVSGGTYAEFFGKQALTINLVHRLANKHTPRVYLISAIRNSAGLFDIRFDELTQEIVGQSETAAAKALNTAIEAQILLAPEQYQWTYKRFKRPEGGGANIYR